MSLLPLVHHSRPTPSNTQTGNAGYDTTTLGDLDKVAASHSSVVALNFPSICCCRKLDHRELSAVALSTTPASNHILRLHQMLLLYAGSR